MTASNPHNQSIVDVVADAQALSDSGRLDEAIAVYKRWLEQDESLSAYAAYFNLAVLYLKLGKAGLAQAALRKSLSIKLDFEIAKSICPLHDLDAHRPMAARASYGHSQLRVALIGSDTRLNTHWFTVNIKSLTSPTCTYEVFGWGAALEKTATDISSLTDDEVACMLREREIDVLIDLMGWSPGARPGIIAFHPASYQISWLDVPQPSGLAAIDGSIIDSGFAPLVNQKEFSETLLILSAAEPEAANNPQHFSQSAEEIWVQAHRKLPLRPPSGKLQADVTDYIKRPTSKGRRYTIAAPPYAHNSAGIRVLYDLQKWLIYAGYDAIVCTWFPGYPVETFADDIAIYPEVAPGNLFNAKRIVRYIMNTPGKLGYGERTYGDGELLVAYNRSLAPYADGLILQVPSTESFFHSNGAVREKDAFYVGKGKNLGTHPDGCLEITKTFPPTRREVAEFLRTVDTLYLYDDFTMLAHEAALCGCQVTLFDRQGAIQPVPSIWFPSPEEFAAQLHRFIELTQALE